MTRSRIASLERAFVAALTTVALLAPALHGIWTHQLAPSSDAAEVTRADDVAYPVGGASDGSCGACLASNQGRTALRGPAEPAVAAFVAAPQRASRCEAAPRGILPRTSAPPRAPPLV